jgi:hypothetical protein
MEALKGRDLFWHIYDQYVETGDIFLRSRLSELLTKFEEKSRSNQILRPVKGWNKILAWQALRNQEFIVLKPIQEYRFFLREGEIIIWDRHGDRDILITRVPNGNFISNTMLKFPGHVRLLEERVHYESETIFTDERGLYLPLYEPATILRLSQQFRAEADKEMTSYIRKEFSFVN